MERGASSTAFPNSKRKAAEAALDEGLSDGEDAAVVDAAVPATDQLLAAPQQQQDQGAAAAEAPKRPKAIRIMSREWIDYVLSNTFKSLPFKERQLQDPELAAIFHSHERSRARFVAYQDRIRRELETNGYVEVDDDYEERRDLLHAVHKAVFYGREDEEKEAMAKLAALRRRGP